MKSMYKKEKGISLIALVITVVVVLILAAVAITSITGNDSIIAKAREARETQSEVTNAEETRISEYENLIDKRGEKNSTDIYGRYYPEDDPTGTEGIWIEIGRGGVTTTDPNTDGDTVLHGTYSFTDESNTNVTANFSENEGWNAGVWIQNLRTTGHFIEKDGKMQFVIDSQLVDLYSSQGGTLQQADYSMSGSTWVK